MPTIAQNLCQEIVEPILAPSNEIASSRKSLKSVSDNPSIRFQKPTRSIIVEKKRVIKKLEPTSKTVINKFKSKESILRKDFTDTGVNTLISGPLRNDNHCVTNVRKRDNYCTCKSLKKMNCKVSSKHIQTFNKSCSQSDKACTHIIDTNNCGTQFVQNLHNNIRTQISNRLLLKKSSEFIPQFSYINTSQTSSRISKIINSNQNGKRWALSNYPTRGPDF